MRVKNLSVTNLRCALKRDGFFVGKIYLPVKTASLPTPTHPHPKRNRLTEMALRYILRIAGYSGVSYMLENGGNFVRDVAPLACNRHIKSSHGGGLLDIHTEFPVLPPSHTKIDCLHPISPHVIILLCMRQDRHVPTGIVQLDSVLRSLNPKTIEILQKPFFTHSSPPSYGDNFTSEIKPILFCKNGDLRIQFNALTAAAKNAEGQKALNALRETLAREPRLWVRLKPGEFVIFDNQRILHERGCTITRIPHGRARWLKRVYGIRNMPYTHTTFQI